MERLITIVVKRIYFPVCVVLFMLFASVGNAQLPQDSFRILSLHEKEILTSAVFKYTTKILELNQDLLNLRNDKEWVKVKIHNIQDQNRLIPRELRGADVTLGRKIQLVDKEIIRLHTLSRHHLDGLLLLDRKVKARNDNQTPSWWYIEKWLAELMYPGAQKKQPDKTAAASVVNKTVKGEMVSPKDNSPIAKTLQEKIDAVGLENWVSLIPDEDPLRLEVQLPILFGSGKTNVAKDYKKFFRKLSWLLKPYPIQVEITGFTDKNVIKVVNIHPMLMLS